MLAWIRSWRSPIRRIVLLLGFVAISFYIDLVLLDIDGSQVRTYSTASWTDCEDSGGEAERLAQAVVPLTVPVVTEWVLGSEETGRLLPGHSIQSMCRRVLRRTPAVSRQSHSPSLSADPV